MAVDKICISIKPQIKRLLDELVDMDSRGLSAEIEYLIRQEGARRGIRIDRDDRWHVDWFNSDNMRIGTVAFDDADETQEHAHKMIAMFFNVHVTPPARGK